MGDYTRFDNFDEHQQTVTSWIFRAGIITGATVAIFLIAAIAIALTI